MACGPTNAFNELQGHGTGRREVVNAEEDVGELGGRGRCYRGTFGAERQSFHVEKSQQPSQVGLAQLWSPTNTSNSMQVTTALRQSLRDGVPSVLYIIHHQVEAHFPSFTRLKHRFVVVE